MHCTLKEWLVISNEEDTDGRARVTADEERVIHVVNRDMIRYDTIVEFNVDSKAEYTAKSSTRSQKLKTKQCPFNSVQVKIREVSPEGIRVTMEERICERDEF